MTKLASKAYWNQFDATPEFVVMFLPGEAFFSAALQHDPSLIEFGARRTRRAGEPDDADRAAQGGRPMAGGRSASRRTPSRSARSGASCTTACSRWPATSTRCAGASRRAVDAYNKSVGSLESRVLPAARKFKELGAAPGAEIDELKPVQTAARTLQSPDLAPLLDIVEAEPLEPWRSRPMPRFTSRGDDGGRW